MSVSAAIAGYGSPRIIISTAFSRELLSDNHTDSTSADVPGGTRYYYTDEEGDGPDGRGIIEPESALSSTR